MRAPSSPPPVPFCSVLPYAALVCQVTLRHITSRHVALRDVLSLHVMSCLRLSLRASHAHFTPEEQAAITVSKKPTTIITASVTFRTTEQATTYVKDLDMFLTVQLLKDSPAILSLGKLCREHDGIRMNGKIRRAWLCDARECSMTARLSLSLCRFKGVLLRKSACMRPPWPPA